jgi:hypothetical protein
MQLFHLEFHSGGRGLTVYGAPSQASNMHSRNHRDPPTHLPFVEVLIFDELCVSSSRNCSDPPTSSPRGMRALTIRTWNQRHHSRRTVSPPLPCSAMAPRVTFSSRRVAGEMEHLTCTQLPTKGAMAWTPHARAALGAVAGRRCVASMGEALLIRDPGEMLVVIPLCQPRACEAEIQFF